MKHLKISSQGEMEVEAMSLIGASTKRGDSSKVGMFGSGLKYSIATILRQKIPFQVFSGFKEFKITTVPVTFRDTKFNKILINGQETSLTDSMGTEDWKGSWPFIREIYSNALDEGQAAISIVDEIIPDEGKTTFFISINESTQEIVDNFEKYFITQSKYLYTDGKGSYIHSGDGTKQIFRKGIRVGIDKNAKALFSYDLANVAINESRELRYSWSYQDRVAEMIESCTDTVIINRFFNGLGGSNTGYIEHECILEPGSSNNSSKEFNDYITQGKFYPVEIGMMLNPEDRIGRVALSIKILRRFLKLQPDADIHGMTSYSSANTNNMYIIQNDPSEVMLKKVSQAVNFLKSSMYAHRLQDPIKICKFKSERVLGRAHKGTILLSDKLESKPMATIATIIIEEQEHLVTDFKDETREFQTHLFELLYGQLEYSLDMIPKSLLDTAKASESEVSNRFNHLTEKVEKYNKLPWYKRALLKVE